MLLNERLNIINYISLHIHQQYKWATECEWMRMLKVKPRRIKNDDEGFCRTVSTRIAVVFFVNGRNGDENYYYGVQNYKNMNEYGMS